MNGNSSNDESLAKKKNRLRDIDRKIAARKKEEKAVRRARLEEAVARARAHEAARVLRLTNGERKEEAGAGRGRTREMQTRQVAQHRAFIRSWETIDGGVHKGKETRDLKMREVARTAKRLKGMTEAEKKLRSQRLQSEKSFVPAPGRTRQTAQTRKEKVAKAKAEAVAKAQEERRIDIAVSLARRAAFTRRLAETKREIAENKKREIEAFEAARAKLIADSRARERSEAIELNKLRVHRELMNSVRAATQRRSRNPPGVLVSILKQGPRPSLNDRTRRKRRISVGFAPYHTGREFQRFWNKAPRSTRKLIENREHRLREKREKGVKA